MWGASVQARERFKDEEKRRMTLSQDTLEVLRMTVTAYMYSTCMSLKNLNI